MDIEALDYIDRIGKMPHVSEYAEFGWPAYRFMGCRCYDCCVAVRESKRGTSRANARRYYHENKEKYAAAAARRRHLVDVAMDEQDKLLSAEYRKAIKNDPCYYCGERKDEMHMDHYMPLAKGGTDHWWNLVRACANCNLSKGDKLPTGREWQGKVTVRVA
ncbi:HNH endonuclease [Micromonospora sp. NPDC049044]|uniref:HNH endonuclease n=1 Tax=Micromonospora sp. NPDC049044 TaxID=3154827 RepID=UPI0033CA0EAE